MSGHYELAVPIKDILRIMGICRTKFNTQHRDEMLQCGALFKVRTGHPPREHLMGFPSRIQAYIAAKASNGETL